MRNYEKYTFYKEVWNKSFPSNWELLPLYALGKVKSITEQTDLQLLSVYLDAGVIPFASKAEKRTNVTSKDLSKYQRVDPGDFVLNNQQAWRGSVGVSFDTGIVSPAYIVLEMNDKLDPRFANYLFRARIMVDQYLINSKSVGSIQRNIYWPALKRTRVPVPSHSEQEQIIRYLDWKISGINGLINLKKKEIENLKELRNSAIDDGILHGFHTGDMKDSDIYWLGDIPSTWEVMPIKRVAKINASVANIVKVLDDEELWGIEYTPKVKVSLYTKNNVDYLRVSDNGVGMNQHIIDNYYTNVGCSYYSSREFSELMVSFKSSFTPISRFGIGILSCFMVCDSMEVTTRRIRERFECDEALHISIEGYESLFVISDSNKKEPGTDTILTLRPVHPWDRMNEEEFMQCIKGIVPNPAVQIEIETNKGSELYSSDYFDDLDLKPLLDYSWNNIKNIRKIDIDLTCEAYGFKGKGCIGILIKNGLPAEEIEILSKDVEIDGEIYTLSSNIKYKTNCITETSTSISVDEDGEIDTNTSWSERFKSKASLSIHGIEVPYNLFPDYSNGMSKAALKIPFPFSFRLDIGVNSDLNLNSARDQIIYDEKWLTFEENLYRIICRRLKDTLSSSDWKILNEIIQKNNTDTFSRVANSFE